MRVKRLEIQGFKSFKDKTVVHFDHSITGIVGPNGCGKSNIVDAFFWVMGEQSYKHIRGTGSDDLIFNGSAKYNPLGMAEATLVLETNYVDTEKAPAGASAQDLPSPLKSKEISVTRRVYRGGEGEYLINGLPSRLKDIHELFMDTGVGAKGYSVIEQGQIGKIVNAKPEDRRRLVEDAAGIAKYKARKKESLRKLDSARTNLSRLSDIIQEIERNLKSLERQAQRAKKYKEYKDELFEKEITWGRRKFRIFGKKIEELKSERETLEQEVAGLRAELGTSETSAEADRVAQLEDSKKAEEFQDRIQELSKELAQEESALELSKRRQDDLAQQLESMNQERSELEEGLNRDRQSLQSKEDEVQKLGSETGSVAARVEEIDQNVGGLRSEMDKVQRQLDEVKTELMENISASSDFASKSSAAEAKAESDRDLLEKTEERKREQENRIKALQVSLEQEEVRKKEIESRLEGEKEKAADETEKVTELEFALEAVRNEKENFQEKLTQARSRLESLEALEKAREGLASGPRSVLEWAEENGKKDSFRVVADLLRVESGYEKALESWLDNRLGSIFSEDPRVASESFSFLERENKGCASIFFDGADSPNVATSDWESIRTSVSNSGFEVLGELKNFVSSEVPSIRKWIDHVCVVKSMGSMEQIFETDRLRALSGWSIVSLDGRVFTADGLMRGGSTETSEEVSLIGRKKAIEELHQTVAGIETEIEKIQNRFKETESVLHSTRQALEETRKRLSEVEIEKATCISQIGQVEASCAEASSHLEELSREAEGLAAVIESATQERKQLEEEIRNLHSRRTELEARLSQDDSSLKDRSEHLRAREEALQAARIEEASHNERLASLTRELDAQKSFISEREARLQELKSLLERVKEQREQQTGGDSGIRDRIESLNREIESRRSELSEIKDRLEQIQAKINSSAERTRQIHKDIDEKTSRANEIAIEVEKNSGELLHLTQNLEEKYGKGCLDQAAEPVPVQEEMSEPVITAEMTEEEEALLFEEVERLRDRLRRLGDVNPMALEEFEELKKRYDYLCSERADLELSIENLNEAIEHINETSKDRFRQAFQAIAERFEKLFPIIFGGGRAELSLIYPEGSEDILDAGIEILAQPPGKKIVNIGLLSGGEKALTAISLIFAIFMVKPSPFCILDEVDAPLDDANIGKFNALLKEMSEKTQFILITHNKKTMELNDTLYGVTMEDPGVSKMVSIEMN